MRPRTSAPRWTTLTRSDPSGGPPGPIRSSASPRQSRIHTESPRPVVRSSSASRAKYSAPWTSGSTALPSVHDRLSTISSIDVRGLPRWSRLRNQSSIAIGTKLTQPGTPVRPSGRYRGGKPEPGLANEADERLAIARGSTRAVQSVPPRPICAVSLLTARTDPDDSAPDDREGDARSHAGGDQEPCPPWQGGRPYADTGVGARHL